jgi:hypothetical protein
LTGLLNRLDEITAAAVSEPYAGEVIGWLLVVVGGVIAVLAAGVIVASYFWGDLMAVGDLW